MVDHQEDNGTDDGDQEAIEVEPCHAGHAEEVEEPAADDSPYDAEQDVQDDPLAGSIYDLAGDKSRDESQDDPCENRHDVLLSLCSKGNNGHFGRRCARSALNGYVHLPDRCEYRPRGDDSLLGWATD